MSKDRWPVTRASIIHRIRDPADSEAWRIVVDIYSSPVYQFCIRKGLQPADALDVTQEVFAKLPQFDYQPDKGKFRAWLGTVTKNQVFQFWRKTKNQKSDFESDSRLLAPQDDLNWERISKAHILDSAIKRIRGDFSETQWSAFEAVALSCQIEDQEKRFVWNADGSAAEVAKQVGKSVDWVYKTKSEVLKRLREEIVYLAEELSIID